MAAEHNDSGRAVQVPVSKLGVACLRRAVKTTLFSVCHSVGSFAWELGYTPLMQAIDELRRIE